MKATRLATFVYTRTDSLSYLISSSGIQYELLQVLVCLFVLFVGVSRAKGAPCVLGGHWHSYTINMDVWTGDDGFASPGLVYRRTWLETIQLQPRGEQRAFRLRQDI